MDWQTPIAILCVLLAGHIVSRRLWTMLRGSSSGCGNGCNSCPSNKSGSDSAPLVTLEGFDTPGKTGK